MIVTNAIAPTEESFAALLSANISGPVHMVNLLKFRERAAYEDGRDSDLTGEQAFDLYGASMRPHIEAGGGRTVFTGKVQHLLVGQSDELWDRVIVVAYPSKEAFFSIVSAPEVEQNYGLHRAAGLAGQLLLVTEAPTE